MRNTAHPEYDFLVIGGRVAGSSLALLLAAQGHRVLVVERDEFPSDTMSTHFLNFTAVEALHKLGVLPDVLAAGFRPITRHRAWIGDCALEGPSAPPGAFSLTPRRNVLDSVLAEHAVRRGAHLMTQTRAESLIEDEGQVAGAVVRTGAGERLEVRARVVVGADGKRSSVAAWAGAETYDAVSALRPGYYGYFLGVEPRPEATVELFFGGGHIGFLFPMRPGEDCIALEIQAAEFDDFRRDARGNFERRFRAFPEMERRLRGARLEGKLIGVKGVDNYLRRPFGPGWVLTGDAAHLKDPSTGTGIADAFLQSFLLADALDRWMSGAGWEEALGQYHARRDAMVGPMYASTLAFTEAEDLDNARLATLRAVLISPLMTRELARGLAGLLPQVYPQRDLDRVDLLRKAFTPRVEEASLPSAR